jgi:hypothetical protein
MHLIFCLRLLLNQDILTMSLVSNWSIFPCFVLVSRIWEIFFHRLEDLQMLANCRGKLPLCISPPSLRTAPAATQSLSGLVNYTPPVICYETLFILITNLLSGGEFYDCVRILRKIPAGPILHRTFLCFRKFF